MALKPTVVRHVLAEPAAIAKALGPKLATRFVPNPKLAEYAFVLRFPSGVVTARAVAQALRKLSEPKGSILLAGDGFTVEARQIARANNCEVVSLSDFCWTDAEYASRYGYSHPS